jgi:hypothetical protein
LTQPVLCESRMNRRLTRLAAIQTLVRKRPKA